MRKLILACVCLTAFGAAQAQTMGANVGKPLKAAQEAMQKKQWDQAMVSIKQAQAVEGKSAYEQYTINEMQAYVLTRQNDSVGAARLFEQNLNSGQVPPGEVANRIKTLAQMYFQNKNYPKATEFGNRWIKGSGADDPAAYLLVAQSYYLSNNFGEASRVMQQGIDTARRTGKPVQENWLLLKLNSLYSLNKGSNKGKQDAAILATREQLVRAFPKTNYWKDLLDLQANSDAAAGDDLAKLNFSRLMLDLGVLSNPLDYVEMAQMNLERKTPAEAVTVMEKGFESKVLDPKNERYNRLITAAKASSQTIQQGLPQQEKAAAASATGEADVQLGAEYLSYGDAPKAIAALQRGIKKGGLKNRDDAQIILGRAYLKANQKEEARKAFQAVPEDSKLGTVASLWALRAQQ